MALFVLAVSQGSVGIIAGVGGAIVVALITASTTNRRQRESLAHDRKLFDLADLRKLLDRAALAIDQAWPAVEVVNLTRPLNRRQQYAIRIDKAATTLDGSAK